LRTDLGPRFKDYLPLALWFVGIALVFKPLVYNFFGLYRRMWMYASIQELKLIVVAVTSASVVLALIVTLLNAINIFPDFPRSIVPIDWLLSLVLIGGLRFSMRVLAEIQPAAAETNSRSKRVLVVGAGDAGALVVREMQRNPNLPLQPVCFLDDDPDKQRQHPDYAPDRRSGDCNP
jgi:FlaA1/EpsC-like NDP-sugar epimerase